PGSCGAMGCLSPDTNLYGDQKDLDEDNFIVYYLQDMNVVADPLATTEASPPGIGVGAGHSLTLDGQSDTDYYKVFTTGSHGSPRNYVLNVLDTGAPNNGADELAIYGINNTDDFFNGYMPGTTTRNATDDIFLLRATKCIDTEAPYGVSAINYAAADHGVP